MDTNDIKIRVAEIASFADDPEAAHSLEDGLYMDVLAQIAHGTDNAAELATEALKASELGFARWGA